MMSKQESSSDDRQSRHREYMAEVQRRNEQSAERRARLAGSPEVGIFWDVNGRLIFVGAYLEEAVTIGRFAHYPMTQETVWLNFRRNGIVPPDMEYDDPPRGRVVYDKVTRRFRLYADACIIGNHTLIGKIRTELNLAPEIEVDLDDFYQCAKCVGLVPGDAEGLTPKRRRKRGLALNREEYVYYLASLIQPALRSFFQARIGATGAIRDIDPLQENEARRLVDLQIPCWISVAPANGRFGRAKAVEKAIGQIEGNSHLVWKAIVKWLDASTPGFPEREQLEIEFFSWVRSNCSAAVGRPADRITASPERALEVWNNVSAAMTYRFELEIGAFNGYSLPVPWWNDPLTTFLQSLTHWIEVYKEKAGSAAAIRAGVDMVLVDRIRKFAITEIARQLGKRADELLLPDRDDIETSFFAGVDGVCAAALRAKCLAASPSDKDL
jgi:hypothetical protein